MSVITTNGYVAVFLPSHPMAACNGYVYEHRLVMANHLDRMLEQWEQVHHKDQNKLNNALDNLELTTDEWHRVKHRTTDVRLRMPDETNSLVHCACNCGGTLLRFDNDGRERKYLSGHNKNSSNTKGISNPKKGNHRG